MEFTILKDWRGTDVDHDPVRVALTAVESGVVVSIEAPFFNDPGNPGGKPGQPYDELWLFEVVEVFFLDSAKEEYLEAEFCPHGQHQVLLLKGRRNMWKSSMEIDSYESHINGSTWMGKAILPWGYFPRNIDKVNAYAIHGSGERRKYEALHPATEPHESPDFHRLQYFGPFQLGNEFIDKRRSDEVWEKIK